MKKLILLAEVVLLMSCTSTLHNKSMTEHEKLSALTQAIRSEYNIPALAVVVVNSDGVIDQVISGEREFGKGDPAGFSDYFHLGSNTKAMTAFLAAKLVEDGMLSWNTRFFDLLPELEKTAREEYKEITLAGLLSHRAWLPSYSTGKTMSHIPELSGSSRDQRLEFSSYALQEKPSKRSAQSPFKKYAYSNAGFVLAATMLEAASNTSWENLVEKVFNEELQLAVHNGWPIELGPEQPRGHLPGGYFGEKNTTLMVYDKEYKIPKSTALAPSGNLSISITNYARFIQMHLQGLQGKDNYLPAESYSYMHYSRPQYAMGWENSSGFVSSHSGSTGNFFSHVYIDSKLDTAIIISANSGILNALKPLQYFFGGIRLERYLKKIMKIYGL